MARKMRDSGVEWIGEVPDGWKFFRAKRLFKKEQRPIRPEDEIVTAFRDGEVTLRKNRRLTGFTEATDYSHYQGIRKGDLVIHQMDAFAGCVGISDSDGMGSPILSVCTAKTDRVCIRYYSAIIRMMGRTGYISSLARGVRERSADFRFETFAKEYLPVPPLPEQRRIADYLDEKCAAIDGAVCELKRGIEDCKAWKKAIIFEAVTGKANVLAASACAKATADKKNAKVAKRQMRDSGIPWIGEIPEGWEVRRLKFIFDEITDGSHFSPEGVADGMPYVTATDIRGVGIDFTKVKRISETDYNELVNNGCKVQLGDILLVKDGATTGRVGLMVEQVDCVALSSVAMLRTKKYCNRFFMYVIFSELLQKQIMLAMAGSAMPRITISKLNEFLGVLPPLPEQQAIADYLDEKCAAIDALVAEKEKLIADLEAYKKSLIFELVTGKREVA